MWTQKKPKQKLSPKMERIVRMEWRLVIGNEMENKHKKVRGIFKRNEIFGSALTCAEQTRFCAKYSWLSHDDGIFQSTTHWWIQRLCTHSSRSTFLFDQKLKLTYEYEPKKKRDWDKLEIEIEIKACRKANNFLLLTCCLVHWVDDWLEWTMRISRSLARTAQFTWIPKIYR